MPSREDKIRERLFPRAQTFDPSQGGYTAIPFVLRRAQFLFDPRSWQVYTYILMRIGPSGVGWLALSEMAWDLDFKSIPKLKPYVDKLVKDGWLLTAQSRARDYFLAPDPVAVLRRLAESKKLTQDRIDAIDEVLESLKLDPLG